MRNYNPKNTVKARAYFDERYPTLVIEELTNPYTTFIGGNPWISDIVVDSGPYEDIPVTIVRQWNIATDLLAQVEREYREWRAEQEEKSSG